VSNAVGPPHVDVLIEGPTVDFVLSIFDHVAHPIFVKDRSFRFVLLNRALVDTLGFEREAMLGKTDYDFFPKEEADFFRAKDTEVFETGRTVAIEEECITDKAGKRHVLATTKALLRSPDGEITYLVGIIHDITRLKEAEEALRQSNEELEQRVLERTAALRRAQDEIMRKERLTVLGKLAGGLAHQIRNPLAAIRNAAHILESSIGAEASAPASAALRIIFDEVGRANQHVTDLLDYARVRPPTRRLIDIGFILDQATGGQSIPPSIQVVLDVPTVAAYVDAGQTQSAFYNLIRNAVEAMHGGGTLTFRACLDGDWLTVDITDTGPGVSPEIRARMFEPLVTSKPSGLGLGLSTARALIENQGGRLILCDPRADGVKEGAHFQVILPASTNYVSVPPVG
jgi:PAS domain S-box-containing protein